MYRYLLADVSAPVAGRIYFITTTPREHWGETGDWTSIPAAELQAFPHAAKHRPAHEAHLKEDRVLEKGTDAEAWMRWISVKR